MSKISIKANNLNVSPHITAVPLKDIKVGTFVQLVKTEANETKKEITESQFFLLPKTDKALIVNKTENDVVLMKFNRVLGDGEYVVIPNVTLAIEFWTEELIIHADFKY